MPELQNDQCHQPPKQIHIEGHTEQIEAAGREDHCWRTGRLQSRKRHHTADLQPENPLWKIPPAPGRLYHVVIDFKKAFNRIWHAALWATMKQYNIIANFFQVNKHLYGKATSAVLFNGSIGDWFRRTVRFHRDVYSNPPSSAYFWKGSWQTP